MGKAFFTVEKCFLEKVRFEEAGDDLTTPPDRETWPRISIITPSLNQGKYLEDTMRSVLSQEYPNLEYRIIDGGSSDNSLEVIRRYEPYLAGWASEADKGQAHAINKGFAQCSGELLGWLNSDDILLPGALKAIASAHLRHPQAILMGEVYNYFEDGDFKELVRPQNISFEALVEPWRYNVRWHQPGIYVPAVVFRRIGPLDVSLRYTFDQDWMCRALQSTPVVNIETAVAQFRIHRGSKTGGHDPEAWYSEELTVAQRYWRKTRDFDERLSRGALEVHHAGLHLRLRNFERRSGARLLWGALKCDWRVLKLRKFWLLCLKLLLPLPALVFSQRLALRFFKRALWLTY